jgi:hypothetical protein
MTSTSSEQPATITRRWLRLVQAAPVLFVAWWIVVAATGGQPSGLQLVVTGFAFMVSGLIIYRDIGGAGREVAADTRSRS